MTTGMVLLAVLVFFLQNGECQPLLTDQEKEMIVDLHNGYRRLQRASNMKKILWDDALANEAQAWVNRCIYDFRLKSTGENMYYFESNLPNDVLLERAIDAWYSERYAWKMSGDCKNACSYTQVVWAKSNRIGCAINKCGELTLPEEHIPNAWYIYCVYNPKGNVYGERPYKEGIACSQCDRNEICRDKLCAENKVVTRVPPRLQPETLLPEKQKMWESLGKPKARESTPVIEQRPIVVREPAPSAFRPWSRRYNVEVPTRTLEQLTRDVTGVPSQSQVVGENEQYQQRPSGQGQQRPYGPKQYGPGQQRPYGLGQQGQYGPGQQGPGQQAPYGPGQQGQYGPGQSQMPGRMTSPQMTQTYQQPPYNLKQFPQQRPSSYQPQQLQQQSMNGQNLNSSMQNRLRDDNAETVRLITGNKKTKMQESPFVPGIGFYKQQDIKKAPSPSYEVLMQGWHNRIEKKKYIPPKDAVNNKHQRQRKVMVISHLDRTTPSPSTTAKTTPKMETKVIAVNKKKNVSLADIKKITNDIDVRFEFVKIAKDPPGTKPPKATKTPKPKKATKMMENFLMPSKQKTKIRKPFQKKTETTTQKIEYGKVLVDNCLDQHKHCKDWVIYCKTNAYVFDNCPKTCRNCHVPPPPPLPPPAGPPKLKECKDLNVYCPHWTKFCYRNKYVTAYCQKQCKTCGHIPTDNSTSTKTQLPPEPVQNKTTKNPKQVLALTTVGFVDFKEPSTTPINKVMNTEKQRLGNKFPIQDAGATSQHRFSYQGIREMQNERRKVTSIGKVKEGQMDTIPMDRKLQTDSNGATTDPHMHHNHDHHNHFTDHNSMSPRSRSSMAQENLSFRGHTAAPDVYPATYTPPRTHYPPTTHGPPHSAGHRMNHHQNHNPRQTNHMQGRSQVNNQLGPHHNQQHMHHHNQQHWQHNNQHMHQQHQHVQHNNQHMQPNSQHMYNNQHVQHNNIHMQHNQQMQHNNMHMQHNNMHVENNNQQMQHNNMHMQHNNQQMQHNNQNRQMRQQNPQQESLQQRNRNFQNFQDKNQVVSSTQTMNSVTTTIGWNDITQSQLFNQNFQQTTPYNTPANNGGGANECVDTDYRCVSWAGYCGRNPHTDQNCRKTCQYC